MLYICTMILKALIIFNTLLTLIVLGEFLTLAPQGVKQMVNEKIEKKEVIEHIKVIDTWIYADTLRMEEIHEN